MNDTTQSRTESLLDIIKGINNKTVMLPEFQRDFRWELDQTYDLFDSLIREIFVGTIIYGIPSFGMTLREIDLRPRKGKGSSAKLVTVDYSEQQIVKLAQVQNLRIVLDGQQRITSIYRAIVGIDTVFIILPENLSFDAASEMTLEQMQVSVAGEESNTAISIKLSDAYNADKGLDDEELNEQFNQSMYAQRQLINADDIQRKQAEKLYRRTLRKVIDLFKQQKMLSYYLLDMSIDKFCVFFERSNSRGIQLNFTDILAAKLYHGFNLRREIEEFESENRLTLNREIIIRAIAYITGSQRGERISIEKSYILEKLDANDFKTHWKKICSLYKESLDYLVKQHYILSQDWMPSENMIIPLIMFRRQLKSFDQMTEEQRRFIEFWYWGSIFANRYSSASNEVIVQDCSTLVEIARSERISARGYFTKMRSLIQEPDDLFSFTKKTSATYRGILNLVGYEAQGLLDWNNKSKITVEMRLEDHHIYPRAYIASEPKLDMDQAEALQLVDCVVNRTLIPKLLNIQIGKKAPQTYLSELSHKNSYLDKCLETHLISKEIITDSGWNECFKMFLEERARSIFELIKNRVILPHSEFSERYGVQTNLDASQGY